MRWLRFLLHYLYGSILRHPTQCSQTHYDQCTIEIAVQCIPLMG